MQCAKLTKHTNTGYHDLQGIIPHRQEQRMEVGALGDPHKPSSKDINKMNRKLTGLSTQFTQLMAALKENRELGLQAANDNKARSPATRWTSDYREVQGPVCGEPPSHHQHLQQGRPWLLQVQERAAREEKSINIEPTCTRQELYSIIWG